jgi:predicted RNase H-like HicB family nuclease
MLGGRESIAVASIDNRKSLPQLTPDPFRPTNLGHYQARVRLAILIRACDDGLDMNSNYHVIIERDAEGYYVASVPALPGCHTQARSLDDLSERIKEAIALYREVQGDTTEPLDFIGIQRVTVAP